MVALIEHVVDEIGTIWGIGLGTKAGAWLSHRKRGACLLLE